MTNIENKTPALLPTREDREAACKFYGFDDEKDLVYWGNVSKHREVENLAEAFAAYRLRHSPAPDKGEWESFCDRAYFGLWCVRRKGDTTFGQGFHVQSKAEADGLIAALATATPPEGDAK